MNKIISFAKRWTLIVAIFIGTITYLLFSRLPILIPIGEKIEPLLTNLLPTLIFVIMYLTYVKIDFHDFKPRKWHFIIQALRTLMSLCIVGLIILSRNDTTKLILSGIFVCVVCPTAAAAPVIAEKLGGSVGSLTVFSLIAVVFTSILVPALFPLVENNTNITFWAAFFMVFKRVLTVLIMPLILAFITKAFIPNFADYLKGKKDLAFYLWGFNLSVVMGITIKSITNTSLHGTTLILMLTLPLLIAIILFTVGKIVGHYWGESINAGQAFGQRNTVVGIWLAITFLNPTVAIAPCAYVIWQNLINAYQLWYKDKYGKLKW